MAFRYFNAVGDTEKLSHVTGTRSPLRLIAAGDRTKKKLGRNPRFPKLADFVTTTWRWHKKPNGYLD